MSVHLVVVPTVGTNPTEYFDGMLTHVMETYGSIGAHTRFRAYPEPGQFNVCFVNDSEAILWMTWLVRNGFNFNYTFTP